jgi:hypothetical protein
MTVTAPSAARTAAARGPSPQAARESEWRTATEQERQADSTDIVAVTEDAARLRSEVERLQALPPSPDAWLHGCPGSIVQLELNEWAAGVVIAC